MNEKRENKSLQGTNSPAPGKDKNMTIRARATFPQIVSFFLCLSPFSATFVANSARADDLTGMAQDDAKDLLPPTRASAPCYTTGFLPMPYWARGVVMPPLPDVLSPMGRKAVLTTPPVPAREPLAPPKDGTTASTGVTVAKPIVVTPGPATQPAPNPALIAVSPFLDWIKANPQAAAEQARQQASSYQTAAEPTGPIPAPNAAPNSNGNAPAVVAPAPYWMPPLIDAAPFTSGTGTTTGSSAAIYSTPQR